MMKKRKKSVADQLPAGFSERLNKLKQSFLDSVPERLSFIDAGLEVIARESCTAADLRQALASLRAKAHELAGAAGTFGFAKFSKMASEAEMACEDLLSSNGVASCAERRMIGELFAALRQCGASCRDRYGASAAQ